MKKLIAVFFASILITGTALAASAPHHLKAKAVQKKAPLITQTYYTCDWQCQCALKQTVQTLKLFHVKTVIYPYQVRVIIPDYMLFTTLSDELKVPNADRIVTLLTRIIRHFPYAKVDIYGYDDDIGLPDNVTHLTLKRAQVIAGKLWLNDIPSLTQTLHYYGRGKKAPIADNDTVVHMADNRRIEVWIRLPH